MKNYNHVLQQLHAFGLDVGDGLQINTPKAVRCNCDLSENKKAGWYWLSTISDAGPDVIVGAYGCWAGTDPQKQIITFDKKANPISKQDLKAIREKNEIRHKKMVAEQKALARKAAKRAKQVWSKYTLNGSSQYLEEKKVGAYGIRFSPKDNGTIAIPIMDIKTDIHGLQIIRESATLTKGKLAKEYFPKGLTKLGHFHLLGRPNSILLIAEGYATASTLHEATNLPVAVAFDANNLLPVAKEWHKHRPRMHILICADDDYLTGKAGEKAAKRAAEAIDGLYILPQFPLTIEGVDCRNGEKLSDFNDLANHLLGGMHLVKQQIEEKIKNLSIKTNSYTERPIDQLQAKSVLSIDDIAERFIAIDDNKGDTVFDLITKQIVSRKKVTNMLPARARMSDLQEHPIWESRAVFLDEVGFDPTETNKKIKCNTFKGWQSVPNTNATPQDCEKILELLKFLCSGEEEVKVELVDWVLKWLAYPIQHPGAKMHTALIFHGTQGTGKSMFFNIVGEIYGEYFQSIGQEALDDSFNSDWVQSLFILAEEVLADDTKRHQKNTIKNLITSPTNRLNQKMVEARSSANHLNMVMLSNEINPYIMERGDRRFGVIWTPSAVIKKGYYSDVKREAENGGVEAFHQYLVTYNLEGFGPDTKPPITRAKQDLIDLNSPPPVAFLNAWKYGDLPGITYGPAPCDLLYQLYLKWAKKAGEPFPGPIRIFSAKIHSVGWEKTRSAKVCENIYQTEKETRRRFYCPSEELMQEAYLNGVATYFKKEMSEKEYYGQCYSKFINETANYYENEIHAS